MSQRVSAGLLGEAAVVELAQLLEPFVPEGDDEQRLGLAGAFGFGLLLRGHLDERVVAALRRVRGTARRARACDRVRFVGFQSWRNNLCSSRRSSSATMSPLMGSSVPSRNQ